MHAGKSPFSSTGDYSDVTVVEADGQRIPRTEVSHFDDEVMRDVMRQIVDRVYTFHVKSEDSNFQAIIERWMPIALGRDVPELDMVFMRAIDARRAAADEAGSGNEAGP